MKLLFLSLFLVGISNVLAAPQGNNGLGGFIDDIIAGIIKGVVEKIITGMPDPINIPEQNIDLPTESAATGHIGLSDLSLGGLKGLKISSLKVVVLPASIDIVLGLPSINLNTKYNADVLLGSLIPIYGDGNANINFKNVNLTLSSGFDFNLMKTSLTLKNVTVRVTIDDATFDLHGVINNEAFSVVLSQILDDTVAPFVNDHAELLSKVLSPILEKLINNLLSGKKSSELYESVSEEVVQKHIINFMTLYVNNLRMHSKYAQLS